MSNPLSVLDRLAVSGTEYPHRPIQELLQVAKQLNVRYLELWIPHNFAFEDVSKVEKELSRLGLSAVVISTWTQLNLPGDVKPRQELIRQSINAAKVLGAHSVNTYFGANPARSAEESISAYREAVMPLVEYAEKEGVIITLENEFEESGHDVTRRAERVLNVLDAVNSPAFKANFDPCNFYFAGEEGYPYAYQLLKNHIGYVHLKDGMKFSDNLHLDPGEGFLWKDLSGEYVCCPMGRGAINYRALLREIVNTPYKGYFGLEPHVRPELLLSTFQQSLRYIQQLLLEND